MDHSNPSDPLSIRPVMTAHWKDGSTIWGIPSALSANYGPSDASLFSSSLPVLPHEKLLKDSAYGAQLAGVVASDRVEILGGNIEPKDAIDEFDHLHLIGNLLPDDEDELLAGITGDFETIKLPGQVEELEDYDVFGSGGGMELDYDPTESIAIGMAKANISDGFAGNGLHQYGLVNGVATVAGEHPYGEHPSRTLFVRNINSNVEDSELRAFFEPFGGIRSLYTATKHRGFVMVSYYDIRDARAAMRELQNKPLRRRKLDIHFSIPKDNPSDKDTNQGTLVIFNLEPSVSNDELLRIFGAYGEVKEIRETPQKRHHKFIEFYDVRAAEAALRALNKSEIAGKRIKLEPSRPGGARRNLLQQLNHDLEQDEGRIYRHHVGSPIASSPPGTWAQFSSPMENNPLKVFSESPSGGVMNPMGGNHFIKSNSLKIMPIGRDPNWANHADHSSPSYGVVFPDLRGATVSSSPVSSFSPTTSSVSGFGTLSGPQFLWGSPSTYTEQVKSSTWQSPPIGHSFLSNGHVQGQGFPYSSHESSHFSSLGHHYQHHVGSAPTGVPFESHFSNFPESPEASFMNQFKFGSTGANRVGGSQAMHIGARPGMIPPIARSGNLSDNNSPNLRMMPSQRLGQIFFGNRPYPGPGLIGVEGLVERGRSRRADNSGTQTDGTSQYQLDLKKIISGEDSRTTIMIKNIPNKYTSKMLLAAIDETQEGTYDFFYLPIDFKNRCNVGYAFINMVSPAHVLSFYQEFNGKKWEKFNSEKVVSLAYARIQGRTALISHFQNSSLMNEDKLCRPILFHPKGSVAGNQGIISSNGMDLFLHKEDGALTGDDNPTMSDLNEKPEAGSGVEEK